MRTVYLVGFLQAITEAIELFILEKTHEHQIRL
jgi:hypothetical protein